jgi:hypothetical protein
MWDFFKKLYKEPEASTEIDADKAITLFKENPSAYFTSQQKPYQWPDFDVKDTRPVDFDLLRVQVGTHTLGFVERAQCFRGTAYIKHIAVSTDFAHKKAGLGYVIAKSFAEQLRERYQVNLIIFQEDHSKYVESGYPKFFRNLGATPLPTGRHQRADRPDFEWLESNWGI